MDPQGFSLLGSPRRSKYRNKKTTVDNIVFASKREAARYLELKAMMKARKIRDLVLQPRFKLEVNGVLVCTYVGDFSYRRGREFVVEDSKGVKTDVYRLKKKLMKAILNIDVVEV